MHEAGRVLILAPAGRDAPMMAQALSRAGIGSRVCGSISELCEGLKSAECAVVAEEVLDTAAVECLTRQLADQPPWSDYPLIVLGVPNSSSGVALFERLSPVANLTLLERPTRPFTLVTVARAALRSRARQYVTREHLEELSAARSEAERVGRMKDEFLATLSHELRTPLNAIAGWVNLMQRGVLSAEDQAKAVETIARNTKAQRQLIEELLDMSRIISGKVRLDPQPVDVALLVRNAVDSVRPTAEAKGLTLTFDIVADSEPIGYVNADGARLQQSVWNLLTNAIKFTAQGGTVAVFMGRRGQEVQISVTDTGAGIAPEFLPFVFDRFRQGDSSSRRSHGGLGLGLSIVKQLIEMHGGRVAAHSRGPGRGSTFSMSIPVGGAAATPFVTAGIGTGLPRHRAAPSKQILPVLRGVNVLIVEDDEDGRFLLKRHLEEARATVLSSASVSEARRMLSTRPVDVLLSDIAMPGEDGHDLIRWVRSADDARLRNLPAAAISAFARPEDRARSLATGFDAHIAKPCDPEDLTAVVQELHARGSARQGLEDPSAPGH
ncbi:MAG TPA: ATP-binding protein [Phycisphaerales bacterium]|nr:ATP-binding protein [Phycisphaerales bacterium]